MSITTLIREVYEETEIVNASELAEEVFNRTPQEEIEGFYRKMLSGTCLDFFASERARVRREAAKAQQEAREAAIADKFAKGDYKPRKTKADDSRTWWEDFNRQAIHVDGKAFAAGDLTGQDWFDAAQQLRTTAKGLDELATKYERIAQVVGDGITRDQDGEVIREIMGE